MPSFGATSKARLATCHEDLQRVLNESIKDYDFSIVWGHRGRRAQELAFREGNSTKRWPDSKHNQNPSLAVDIVPWPLGFDADDEEFYIMATHILSNATKLGIPLRWGGHFTSFFDGAHFELATPNPRNLTTG